VEQARRTIIKSFMGFASNSVTARYKSGFARRYKSNNGVVDSWAEYPAHLFEFTMRLRRVTIENHPADKIFERYDSSDTLFYVDPPYVLGTRNTGGKCYRCEMSDAEHEDLAEILKGLRGG
jgi:DNA adenine methylase